MYVIGSEYWGEKPNLLWILFVGQFSFADTNNGFFFQDLLKYFEAAAGACTGIETIVAIEFFSKFDPGIWIQNAVMEELIFKLPEADH